MPDIHISLSWGQLIALACTQSVGTAVAFYVKLILERIHKKKVQETKSEEGK